MPESEDDTAVHWMSLFLYQKLARPSPCQENQISPLPWAQKLLMGSSGVHSFSLWLKDRRESLLPVFLWLGSLRSQAKSSLRRPVTTAALLHPPWPLPQSLLKSPRFPSLPPISKNIFFPNTLSAQEQGCHLSPQPSHQFRAIFIGWQGSAKPYAACCPVRRIRKQQEMPLVPRGGQLGWTILACGGQGGGWRLQGKGA